MDVTEAVEAEQDNQITVQEDIINVNEINEQGGIIEFAGDMTYKEFIPNYSQQYKHIKNLS